MSCASRDVSLSAITIPAPTPNDRTEMHVVEITMFFRMGLSSDISSSAPADVVMKARANMLMY